MVDDIRDFTEKHIRHAVLTKANPEKINKSGKHWKGYVFIEDVLVTKVKIPNNHNRIMKSSKSQYISQDLRLSFSQFNSFVDCSMTGPEYRRFLKTQI